MDLADTIHHFLFKHGLTKSKLLLAISGGSDSIALLHAFKSKHPFPGLQLAVAHVDHRWRTESIDEAAQLKEAVESLGIEWHLKVLDPSLMKGNLEEASRNARLDFFRQLCEKEGFAGVLLAHHADDQAETVLKRLLEGASLIASKGIQEKMDYDGLVVYRPFLKVTKKQILGYIQQHQLNAFEDPTNFDEKYMRARMRMKMIPHLSELFGKEVSLPLVRMGNILGELDDFISIQLPDTIAGWAGWYVDFNTQKEKHPFVLKHIILKLFQLKHLSLPFSLCNTLSEELQKKAANKIHILGTHQIVIDRGFLFVCALPLPALPFERISLKQGENRFGPWKVTLSKIPSKTTPVSGWQEIWKGNAGVAVGAGNYYVSLPDNHSTYLPKQKALDDWWSASKVPAFLRHIVPVITNEEGVVAEFLGPLKQDEELSYCISIS